MFLNFFIMLSMFSRTSDAIDSSDSELFETKVSVFRMAPMSEPWVNFRGRTSELVTETNDWFLS